MANLGKTKAITLVLIAVVAGMAIVVSTCIGVVVQQPIGAMPDGATIIYWRVGLARPFVESADGLQLERTGKVSLLGRAMALKVLAEELEGRRIATLPYSEWLYLRSTGGVSFED